MSRIAQTVWRLPGLPDRFGPPARPCQTRTKRLFTCELALFEMFSACLRRQFLPGWAQLHMLTDRRCRTRLCYLGQVGAICVNFNFSQFWRSFA